MMIPLDSPLLRGNERKYLNQCIKSNWVSWQGLFVKKLENSLAEYCNTKYCASIVNGTYSLILALKSLGIKPGDEVIVPSFTMSATCFAVSSLGAKVVWVDTEQGSVNTSANLIKEKITNQTKAIIVVHLYGTPVDVNSIKKISKDIPIIEDVAESLGAMINETPVGGLGDIAIHSFHNKIIGSGEGGAITTNNKDLYQKIVELKIPTENNYNSSTIRLNNRMSNISAAVALAQLERIEYLISKRRKVAELYYKEFANTEFFTFKENPNNRNVYWRFQISHPKFNQIDICSILKNLGIEARKVFQPMHLHPVYNEKINLINCENIAKTTIDIPSGPSLTKKQIKFIATTIKNIDMIQ